MLMMYETVRVITNQVCFLPSFWKHVSPSSQSEHHHLLLVAPLISPLVFSFFFSSSSY